jgi:hypothetical protein
MGNKYESNLWVTNTVIMGNKYGNKIELQWITLHYTSTSLNKC